MVNSTPPTGVEDAFDIPLNAGPSQELIQAPGPHSMLDNPGTDGGDERPPSHVPMRAYGWEQDAGALFDLNPRSKG